jgi:hypothetical protein
MVHMQATTPSQRLQLVSQAIAQQGQYGTVSTLSRGYGVSRQTVYDWTAVGRQALTAAFTPQQAGVERSLARLVLTLLTAGHAAERGIQACLGELGQAVSVGDRPRRHTRMQKLADADMFRDAARRHGMILFPETDVFDYLSDHRADADIISPAVEIARKHVGNEPQLSLEVYLDPESSARKLTLYVRSRNYSDDFFPRVLAAVDELRGVLHGNDDGLLIATDFQPPR